LQIRKKRNKIQNGNLVYGRVPVEELNFLQDFHMLFVHFVIEEIIATEVMRYPHEFAVVRARVDHVQIVIFVQLSNRGLHVVLGHIVNHIQTSYSILVGGYERSFAFAHRQRRFGHVAQLGRERFVLRFLQIAQLVAFFRIQGRIFRRFGVIVLEKLEIVLVEH